MPRVELIYEPDCPNLRDAREALLEGFRQARMRPAWMEWNRESPASPAYVRDYGSPTILVDGRDVSGTEGSGGAPSCRIYGTPDGGLEGVPPVHQIASALESRAFLYTERRRDIVT